MGETDGQATLGLNIGWMGKEKSACHCSVQRMEFFLGVGLTSWKLAFGMWTGSR